MYKKFLSIVMATVLTFGGATNVYAQSFWDDSTFTNFTSPGSITDPNGIVHVTSGSFHVKFKALTDFAPWMTVGAPSMKVGCSGISFNAAFASLINFEQLAQQLQQAGASLAWGLLIGLAYSLPALKEIFNTINEWSAKLQKMLADMCSYGKAIAKNTDFAKRIKGSGNTFLEGINKDLKGSFMQTALDSAEKKIAKTIKNIKEKQNKH